MFAQVETQKQQQHSEASNQLRLLKRSIESSQPPVSSSRLTNQNQNQNQNHNHNKKRTNKHRLISSDPIQHKTNKLSKTSNPNSTPNNSHTTPHRSRQVPRRSTLSNRLSSNRLPSSTHRPARITGTHASQSESAIDVLRKLLQARWDPVTKLLDLANLAQDKILKAVGIAAPGQKGAPQRTAGAIWKLCKEICPNVRSISLADNQLQTLQPMSISNLIATLPELANLSLAGNRLASFSDLNALSPTTARGGATTSSTGFVALRELILTGNPLRADAEKAGPPGLQNYLVEVVRRFPSLEVLDGEAIDPTAKATIAANAPQPSAMLQDPNKHVSLNTIPQPALPMSIKPAFLNDSTTSSFVAGFCLQFFNAFDQDRSSLIDVYATKSSFSLCASPYIPSRSKMAGLTRNQPHMPAQQVPSWNEYISISRNNARLKGPKLCDRLANGPAEIVEYMKQIPGTKHPLDVADKFVVDSWQMPGLVHESTSPGGAVIYLTIHGEFQEFPSLTVRSFDRTFLLGAAGPASAAALKGWPCVILTDQLTVRAYSSPQAWSTVPAPAPQPPVLAPTQQPQSAPIPKPELTSDEKNELVKILMDLTKLNVQFTVDCLTQNHWNLDAALKNFNEIVSRGGLPSDAFLPSS
ncbi:hypothetical protein PTTG_06552 [Puccinia triticina 1-1 BBBD Race 1]|uniref:TAP-C domain-containing protein n=2 Tax=Puccinia triticina TaxID=208348 RepID=A0A180GFG6_PUCT1|nr:hypothetical protein PTTG_06552 [Puccinia triticina 1-1 BBBD Race 1]